MNQRNERGPAELDELLSRARGGCRQALGDVLEACRTYLLLVANEELDPELRGKGGASDLVQDTFMEAHEGFREFRGRTEAELLAWLRQILLHNVGNFRRQYRSTAKRQVARELGIDHSSRRELRESLQAETPSPSEVAVCRERLARLEAAIQELPANFREVIVWRNLELQPFAQIALKLNRTEKATQKLWSRAIRELQKIMVNGRPD